MAENGMGQDHDGIGAPARPERRHVEDRRISIRATSVERRQGGDRRRDSDRRGHYHNIFNPDDNFLYEVFMWLVDHTEGEWSTGEAENEPDGSPVTCRIRFEDGKDLEAFVAWAKEWEAGKG